MTWIKICGITNLEDALSAVDAGPDAIGFVFYPSSPRNSDVATVKSITRTLPSKVEKIGVFVNQSSAEIESIAAAAGLTGVQVHFTEAPVKALVFSPSPFKTFLALPSTLAELPVSRFIDGAVDGIFLDSGTPGQPGGTGKVFDWRASTALARNLSRGYKVVIAGGLTSENVADAIQTLKPWGVDVSSGVEARPGKKDPEKVRAFIQAVRHIEVSV